MDKNEYKRHYYNMWNKIVNMIEECGNIVDIIEAKSVYCCTRNLHFVNDCAMCEYCKTDCDNCPSYLQYDVLNPYCLSGI